MEARSKPCFTHLARHAGMHLSVFLADTFVDSTGLTSVMLESLLPLGDVGVIALQVFHSGHEQVRLEPVPGVSMRIVVLKVFCSVVQRYHHSETRRPFRRAKLMNSVGWSNAEDGCSEP